jgi:uncharacterized protein with beta-barrel porin domain
MGTLAHGFALAFGSRDATDTRTEVGALRPRLPGLCRCRAGAAGRGCLGPRLGEISLADAGVPIAPGESFLINGATPSHDSALTSVGAKLRFANHISLLAKFDGEFAAHASAYAGTGTIRYSS